MSETIVVVGGGCWGKGESLAQAKAAFTRSGGRLKFGYGIYTFDADTQFEGIDDYGRYHYVGNPPTLTEVASRVKR